MGKVIQFPRTADPVAEQTVVEPQTVPAHAPADPVGVVRAAVTHARHRAWLEVLHLPRRGWRLLHYFGRGVIGYRNEHGIRVGGWLGLVAWCFAARERADARAIAVEKPGHQLSATTRADHIAVWHSLAVLSPLLGGALAAEAYLGVGWLGPAVLVVAGTTIHGWWVDPKPPPPLPSHRVGDITRDTINEALRAVNILAKPTTNRPDPDGVRIVRLAHKVGGGEEVAFDLPASVKSSVTDVVRLRTQIAASLAIPLQQLVIEPGEHPGRVVLWHARHDPFSGTTAEHPLLDTERWSVFDPTPFGTDARGRQVAAPIVGTHWLVGGVPNSGKTSAARGLTVGPVLDPDTDLFVFDGKRGKDWSALDGTAEQYEAGPIPEQAARLRQLLERLIAEGDERSELLKTLPDDVCPDSAITRGIARDHGMRFVWLVIDEAHRHLADEKHGEAITRLLVQYVRGFRSVGLGLLICTQDAEGALSERFTSVRRVIGTRFALRVMDWQASNMILGDQMNTRGGWDASTILPSQRGTGVLRADLEADAGAVSLARMVRSFYLDNRAWRAVCEHGRSLREQRAQAASEVEQVPDELLSATELLDRFRLLAPEVLPAAVDTAKALGEYLSSRGCRSEGQNAAGQRVRSRLLVEAAVGLPTGCLVAAEGSLGSNPAATVSNLPSGAVSNPVSNRVEV